MDTLKINTTLSKYIEMKEHEFSESGVILGIICQSQTFWFSGLH